MDTHAATRRRPRRGIGARLALAAAALGISHAACGVVIQDDLTAASSQLNWAAFNGACLTAGNGSGTIPACVGLSYYGSDPNALKLRQMNLLYEMNKERGTTVLIPTDMANSLGTVVALARATQADTA